MAGGFRDNGDCGRGEVIMHKFITAFMIIVGIAGYAVQPEPPSISYAVNISKGETLWDVCDRVSGGRENSRSLPKQKMPCMQSKSIPDRMLQKRKSQYMPESLQKMRTLPGLYAEMHIPRKNRRDRRREQRKRRKIKPPREESRAEVP